MLGSLSAPSDAAASDELAGGEPAARGDEGRAVCGRPTSTPWRGPSGIGSEVSRRLRPRQLLHLLYSDHLFCLHHTRSLAVISNEV